MSNHDDVAATKAARREFGKRGLDAGSCDIRVHHGSCQIRGVIRLIVGGAERDIDAAMDKLVMLLRQKPGIRDVVVDADLVGSTRRKG